MTINCAEIERRWADLRERLLKDQQLRDFVQAGRIRHHFDERVRHLRFELVKLGQLAYSTVDPEATAF